MRMFTVTLRNFPWRTRFQALWYNRHKVAVLCTSLLLFGICLSTIYWQFQTAQAKDITATNDSGSGDTQKKSDQASITQTPSATSSPSGSSITPEVGIIPTPSIHTNPSANAGSTTPPDNSQTYPPASSGTTPPAQSGQTYQPVTPGNSGSGTTSAPTRTASTPAVSPTRGTTLTPTATATPPTTNPATPTATDTPTVTDTATDTPTSTVTPSPVPTATITPIPTSGTPTLTQLDQITHGAFGADNNYVPNSWGVQKNRVIRTSNGDVFTTYISAGAGNTDRRWHLMRKTPTGNWQKLQSGDAGQEPINILRGPHDEIYLFTWPGTAGILNQISSSDGGRSFQTRQIPGEWIADQGYSGSTIDAQGNMVIFQTGYNVPGVFYWSYYDAASQQWTFHTTTINYRYTYAFFFLGPKHDLTITAMRDVLRPELGYPSSTGFNYIFNAIKYFYIPNIDDPATIQDLNVAEVQPQNNSDYDITYLMDSYIDTYGRTHILYNNLYNGTHHVVIANGKIIKDVILNIDYRTKARITQDAASHFYIISTSGDGKTLNVYPGADNDTDGTQLAAPTHLDISQFPACTDDDFCHEPTFTIPRAGNPNSDILDGTYGAYTREIYFQINLHGKP
ncbi:hypothetical protein KDI_55140 [Dictyobacter arantiisoli]|uniref:Sialidase domain-containing protein n=2 Tax=Dictyobacter arantiisoli TaxID=2014874 RepID=A0A5A5TK07_9CHLR|nr:hypothetical protein KDI_55140 [Dictyobacter arantiisoli]